MQVKYINSSDKNILAINHLAQDKSLIEVKKIKKEGLVSLEVIQRTITIPTLSEFASHCCPLH